MSLPPRQHRSRRVERYRRNAVIGIPCGIFTILVGIALSIFRWGLFADHLNELVLGIIVFALGYIVVIFGCWFWAKAKGLNDAIVAIGLAPLIVMLIPYVRIVFLHVPQLIAFGMLMMPVMLISIIAVLPNQR